MDQDWQSVTWKAIPSASLHFPATGGLTTWSVLTEGQWGGENTPVVLLTGLSELLAKYLVNSHNLSLTR